MPTVVPLPVTKAVIVFVKNCFKKKLDTKSCECERHSSVPTIVPLPVT
jgi:hypothetical protein